MIYSLVVISIFHMFVVTRKKRGFFSERLVNRMVNLYWFYFLSTSGCMIRKNRSKGFCCKPGSTGMHCTTLPATPVATVASVGNVFHISQKLKLMKTQLYINTLKLFKPVKISVLTSHKLIFI